MMPEQEYIVKTLYNFFIGKAEELFHEQARKWEELNEQEQDKIAHNMHILAYVFGAKEIMPSTSFEELLVELLLHIPRNIVPLPTRKELDEQS